MAANRKQDKSKKKKAEMAETWMEGYLAETGRASEAGIIGEAAAGLSSAVIEIAKPLLEKAESLPERRRILSLAIAVWNMCVLPEREREGCFDQVMGGFVGLAKEDKAAAQDIVYKMSFLIGRRGTLYPEDKRYVLRYSLEMERGEPRLRVVGGILGE